jgi:hypothetical protein
MQRGHGARDHLARPILRLLELSHRPVVPLRAQRGISAMPPKDIYVAKYWRDRATEMRALADGMGGARTAQLLNDLADDFDKLAIGRRFVGQQNGR